MLMLPPVQRAGATRAARDRRISDAGDAGAPRQAEAPAPNVEAVDAAGRPDEPADATRHAREAAADRPSYGHPGRSYAPLVAQLIATALGLSQTRSRRRASFTDALAAYGRRPEREARPRSLA